MPSSAAIEGVERTERKLAAYAAERGLSLRPELVWPGQPLPREQHGPIRHAAWAVAGRLPGGVAGRLRHQAVYGRTFGVEIAGQHTIMVCRIPESVGYVPMLSVRSAGFEPGLFWWAGDRRPREDVGGFESSELDRRYVIEVARGQDQAWLRQLFPPSFIDWLAASTPEDFAFRLDAGVFVCECPQWRGQHRADGEVDPEHLDLLAEAGGRAASRIRDEVLEEAGVSSAGARPDSAAAHAERSAGRGRGRLRKALGRIVGAGDDSVRLFGERHGMQPRDPADFHAGHITLPLPGAASDVLTGTLPGTAHEGELAWLEFSSDVDLQRNYVAAVLSCERELPALWVDADDVTVPGFGDELAGGSALSAARELGLGVSAHGHDVCVYRSSSPGSGAWPSGAEIEALGPAAVEIAASLERDAADR